MLTSLSSLFYVTGEFHRFLYRGRADNSTIGVTCVVEAKEKLGQSYCSVDFDLTTQVSVDSQIRVPCN